jgi:hypothetical protein
MVCRLRHDQCSCHDPVSASLVSSSTQRSTGPWEFKGPGAHDALLWNDCMLLMGWVDMGLLYSCILLAGWVVQDSSMGAWQAYRLLASSG